MKYLNTAIKSVLAGLIILVLGSSVTFAGPGPGPGGPGGPGGSGGGGSTTTTATTAQVFDTSFAVEFSYSCLGGGCHEIDQNLVDEYAASKMTHTMVKCNACHGTHGRNSGTGKAQPHRLLPRCWSCWLQGRY